MNIKCPFCGKGNVIITSSFGRHYYKIPSTYFCINCFYAWYPENVEFSNIELEDKSDNQKED